MVNLKNKYLVKHFNDKFDFSFFILICHSYYLTTSEINLLRHYCKNNSIICFKPKNKISKYFLNSSSDNDLANLFVSHNLVFNSNNFMSLFQLNELLQKESIKIIPLIFLYKGYPIVLTKTNNLLSQLKDPIFIQLNTIKFLYFFNFIIFSFLKKVNLSLFYLIYYANINTINKKSAC